ncbi:MAG TPA: helix-turn-helix domain-containing protein [Candidatus Baltobacteraceae bacterium]
MATFNALVLNGHYAELGVRELARKAGVGRSTFYQHFDDKTALLVEAMYPLLSIVANAAAGNEAPKLPWVLAHFEEQRANALEFFASAERAAIESAVTKLIEPQLPRSSTPLPRATIASTLSRTALGLIADWLAAEQRVGAEELAAVVTRTMLACRSALLVTG